MAKYLEDGDMPIVVGGTGGTRLPDIHWQPRFLLTGFDIHLGLDVGEAPDDVFELLPVRWLKTNQRCSSR